MKKTKILVPALAVLALGMAASVTGTVAWYAANTQVRGSGVSVSAVVAKNLIISNSAHTTWGAAAVATTNTEVPMSPVSTTDFDDYEKYFSVVDGSKVDATSGRAKNGAVYADPLTAAFVEGYNGTAAAKYVRLDTFYVSLQAAATTTIDLQLTVNISASSQAISKALRIGINYGLCNNSTFAYSGTPTSTLYSVTGGDSTYNAIKQAGTVKVGTGTGVDEDAVAPTTAYMSNDATPVALTEEVTAQTSLPDEASIAASFAGGQYMKLEIFSWYEGQDQYCTSGNSINQEVLNIDVMFNYA